MGPNYRLRKLVIIWSILVLLWATLCMVNDAHGWNYPSDGKFKQLLPSNDPWYYIDEENWDVKCPDKFQHFFGSYLGQRLISKRMNKWVSAGLILGIGLYKEYEDAYREGWSLRDVSMDILGIVSAMNTSDRFQVSCMYDKERVMLMFSISR